MKTFTLTLNGVTDPQLHKQMTEIFERVNRKVDTDQPITKKGIKRGKKD